MKFAEEIQGFQVLGPCPVRIVRADVKIAQIDEGMGDRMPVALNSLNLEHLAITSCGCFEVLH